MQLHLRLTAVTVALHLSVAGVAIAQTAAPATGDASTPSTPPGQPQITGTGMTGLGPFKNYQLSDSDVNP